MRKIFLFAFTIFNSICFSQDYNDSISLSLKISPDPDSVQLNKLLNFNTKLLYDQPKEAIANFEKFEKIAEKINCKTCLVWALKDKSISLKNIGNHNAALEALFKALSLSNEGTKSKAAILNNIANVYLETGDNNKAIIYLKNAAEINEKKKFLNYLGINYNNLGIAYKNLNNFPKALFYHKKATELRIKLGKNENLAQSYLNLAEMYADLKKTDSALFFADQAFLICDSIKSDFGLTFVYNCLGSIYFQKNDLQSAKKYCLRSYELSKKLNNSETLLNSTLMLYKINKASSNFPEALSFQEQYYKMKDSLYNIETTKKQLTLEYQNELNTKNAEQEKKDSLAKQERTKQNIIKNIFIGGFSMMFILSLIILNGYRNKRKANKIIAAQKSEVELQKEIVDAKQKEILDSISYAKRLQDAILPSHGFVKQFLPESFILYKPKDIVAGDFYWMEAIDSGVILIAAADCTGHGVPGAMVSVVCSNALNRTVKEFRITEPGKILDKVRELVIETFEKSENEVKDGMDISICSFDKANNELKWSGANNPLWILRNKEIIEFKANKQPIGKIDAPAPFTTHIVQLQKNDCIYIFTDGYADQFGGNKGKKFKYKQLKNFLLANVDLPLKDQQNLLNTTFEYWKGNLEQVDDVLVIGIKI